MRLDNDVPSEIDKLGVPLSSARAQAALLLGMMGLACLLRFLTIGEKSLWFDEAFSLFVASRPLPEMVELAKSTDTHPPLYYVLLSFWIRLFGTSEIALRSLGAALSTATVAGTWWLGRRLGGLRIAIIASFFTAIAPFQIQAAQDARMYPLFGLLTLASWLALDAALGGQRLAWIAYALATVLMMYTHYFAFLNLLGQGIMVVGSAPRARVSWLVSQMVSLILFLPWAPTLIETVVAGKGWPAWRPEFGWESLASVLGMLSFGGYAFGFEEYFMSGSASLARQALVLVPFMGLLLFGLLSTSWSSRQRLLLFAYLIVPIATAFLFSFRHNVFYARYFSFVYPAFAIVLAAGILRVRMNVRPQWRQAVALALVLLFLSVNAWVLNEVYRNPRLSRDNWRGAVALLTSHARRNDLVVVIPGIAYIPFSYYFRGPQRVEYLSPRELFKAYWERIVKNAGRDPGDRAIFRLFARHHDVLWIVATGPYPPGLEKRLSSAVAGMYGVVASADFRGVVVLRLLRTPTWNSDP